MDDVKMTGKNINYATRLQLIPYVFVHTMAWEHDVLTSSECALSEYRHTAKWNLFVNYTPAGTADGFFGAPSW